MILLQNKKYNLRKPLLLFENIIHYIQQLLMDFFLIVYMCINLSIIQLIIQISSIYLTLISVNIQINNKNKFHYIQSLMNQTISKIKLQSLFHFRLGNPVLQVPKDNITFCYSTTKNLFLGCGNTLLVYRLPQLILLSEKEVSETSIIKIALKDEKIFLLTEDSQIVYCYDFNLEDGQIKLFHQIKGHNGKINDFVFNNRILATGSEDYTLRLWEGKPSYHIIKVLSGHKSPIKILATYKDSNILSASSDGQLKFWEGPQEVAQKKFSYKISSLFVNSSTGQLFVTSIDTKSIEVYDISNITTINYINSNKNKKIFRLRHKLNLNKHIMRKVHDLDQSFCVCWNPTGLIFLQKHLNQIILEKQIKNIQHISSVNSLMILVTTKAVFIEDLQF